MAAIASYLVGINSGHGPKIEVNHIKQQRGRCGVCVHCMCVKTFKEQLAWAIKKQFGVISYIDDVI